ncbi:transglycosylase-like protein with SLT domain [Hoeflea halophila]|uniref:Transglycosylase-like protein with SLT domain n=1 Tax=Hoeflea halophila TaxID=714899 RepID=A0A286ID68_9HYPH|nr:transglycosylase SLT domain-containing protein [Hoeflea halophila]SOE17596.1 transglycosylase-like protein with SLT domain [Hoeflea halophila]
MARFSPFTSLFSWLPEKLLPCGQPASPTPPPGLSSDDRPKAIAWGARVSSDFKRKVVAIAARLDMNPNHLMAIMAFETGRSFDPAVTNQTGSGATGLIQFMPATAIALGTTTTELARMDAIAQLDYVEKYLAPYSGRMKDLPSAYMAVLFPRAVDKAADYVLFRKGSKAYKLNRGLDIDGNGLVTKAEAATKVLALLVEGKRPGLIG